MNFSSILTKLSSWACNFISSRNVETRHCLTGASRAPKKEGGIGIRDLAITLNTSAILKFAWNFISDVTV